MHRGPTLTRFSGPWFSLDIFFIGAERRSFKDHFGYSWIDPVPNNDFLANFGTQPSSFADKGTGSFCESQAANWTTGKRSGRD